MNPTLLLKYTDGRELTHDFSVGSFTLGEVAFTVDEKTSGGLHEFVVSFVPSADVALGEIRVDFPLGQDDEVLVFDNSYCTNLFASIKKFSTEDDYTRSREIVCVKSGGWNFNCAFLTADRFFTDFYAWKNLVSVRFYLENKVVRAGEKYVLESFATDTGDALAFFEKYTSHLADRYVTRPRKPVPFGWSSWSCMYGGVTEENLIPEIRNVGALVGKGGLIQVDDGWQGNNTFLGKWKYDTTKFPSGDAFPAKVARENGLDYGLWLAPALVSEESPEYAALEEHVNRENGEKKPSFATVHPLDIGSEAVLRLYRGIFRNLMNECGSSYFKIDFLCNLITRLSDSTNVYYDSGYSVEVYKNFLTTIRETAGDGVFLNACGASLGESAGIFDGIRTSADITWDGIEKMENITWWDVFRNNIQNIILRAPFDRVFITDPDGLVVRGYKTEYAHDNVVLSDEEARCYATAVAMSGGHILLNEETARLGEERMRLFTHILPPGKKAARPRDFFEYPICTESYIKLDDTASMVALWNLSEEDTAKTLDTQKYVSGKAVLIDAWTHDVVAVTDGKITFDMPKHTVRVYLVKRIPEKDGEVLFSASNFWCGYSGTEEDKAREVIYSESGAADGFMPYGNTAGMRLYTRG